MSTNPFKKEAIRKSLHLPAFAFPAIALYSQKFAILILIALMLFYLYLNFSQQKIAKQLSQYLLFFKRSESFDPAPLYLASGLGISIALGPVANSFLAAYVIAICDSAAAITGKRFGKHPVARFNKSIEGSCAFAVCAFLGALYFCAVPQALLFAFVLMIVELVSKNGLDNFVLPIASHVFLKLLTT